MDNDMMASELADSIIAIRVEVVCVRWMVLAVMGSNLTAPLGVRDSKTQSERTRLTQVYLML
jgi:hypothetical protein